MDGYFFQKSYTTGQHFLNCFKIILACSNQEGRNKTRRTQGDTRNSYNIYRSIWKKLSGRSRRIWEENIRMVHKDVKCVEVDCIQVAQGKDKWSDWWKLMNLKFSYETTSEGLKAFQGNVCQVGLSHIRFIVALTACNIYCILHDIFKTCTINNISEKYVQKI